MTKGFHKKQSKRMLAKRRYKIEKKVRDHKKKVKKEAKKSTLRKRQPKDPGIPNSLPFKDEVIKEIHGSLAREKDSRKAAKEELKQARQKGKEKEFLRSRGIFDKKDRFFLLKKQILDAAKEKSKTVASPAEDLSAVSEPSTSTSSLSNLKNYHKEFQKVIEASDVLIEVLDARDPLGTRCPDVEKALIALGAQKRLVLLINKVDLVPKANLEKWIKYLRNEFPTLPFKASTQKQKNHLARNKKSVMQTTEGLLSSSKGCGTHELMSLLKNYCRSEGIKKSITVGVVGLPNVGKSSVINTLKCNRACNVGAVPGVTKVAQKVVLDKNIDLLDCPGIVYASAKHFKDVIESDKTLASVLALRNSIPVDQLDDPVQPVEAILSRIRKEDLMLLYTLPDFNDSSDFLAKVARRFGFLRKGGIVDTESAAKKVLTDWNSGKIKYVTEPPEKYEMSSHVSAEIVSKMSKGFDIDALTAEDDEEMDEEDEDDGDSGAGDEEVDEDDEDDDEDDEDEDEEDDEDEMDDEGDEDEDESEDD